MTHSFEPDPLLVTNAWLRRLARRMVADDAAADDLAQEAWVAALEGPGAATDRPRSWFRGVLRNLAREGRRGDARRERRERRAAPSESLPSAAEIVAEGTLHQRMAEALAEIDEPWRSALFLRFFRDEPLRSIAALQGVSTSTAASRVQRGIVLLRGRLDREYGDRRSWLIAMLPLSRPRARHATMVGGLAANMAAAGLVAAALLVGGVSAVRSWMNAGPGDRSELTSLAAAAVPSPDSVATEALAVEPPRRLAVRARAPGESVASIADRSPGTGLVVRVIDLQGAPASKVDVLAGEHLVGRTDALGRVLLDPAALHSHRLSISDARLATLAAADAHDPDPVILLGPKHALVGSAVDENGAPLEGAEIALELAQSIFQGLGLRRPYASERLLVRTDAEGHFSMPEAGVGEGVFLAAHRDGYQPVTRLLTAAPAGELVLVLSRLPAALVVEGTVVDSRNMPVAGALVTLGQEFVTSDQDGAFRLSAPGMAQGGRLCALGLGFQPAWLELAGAREGPVVLELGPPALAIEGTVVDPRGAPVVNAIVWLRDPTPFGYEPLRHGRYTVQRATTVEGALGDEHGARTNEHGHFLLSGLLPRTYDVQVLDTRTCGLGRGWRVAAGEQSVELTLTPEPGVRRVAGRVVSIGGVPLVGVAITPRRWPSDSDFQTAPIQEQTVTATVTDTQGQFEIPALAVNGTRLVLHGEGIGPTSWWPIEPGADLGQMEIVVPLACELQVDLGQQSGRADGLRVLDEDGVTLPLYECFGSFIAECAEAEIAEGRSSVLSTDERAHTLVLLLRGKEVARLPLALTTGETTIVRP